MGWNHQLESLDPPMEGFFCPCITDLKFWRVWWKDLQTTPLFFEKSHDSIRVGKKLLGQGGWFGTQFPNGGFDGEVNHHLGE